MVRVRVRLCCRQWDCCAEWVVVVSERRGLVLSVWLIPWVIGVSGRRSGERDFCTLLGRHRKNNRSKCTKLRTWEGRQQLTESTTDQRTSRHLGESVSEPRDTETVFGRSVVRQQTKAADPGSEDRKEC